MAHASCELVQPKAFRPNEGILTISVHLDNQLPDDSENISTVDIVCLNRTLEKLLKDSKSVDLESLCLMADEKVWNLRVEVYILNSEGSILDCASIAALCALKQVKIPHNVSFGNDQIDVGGTVEQFDVPVVMNHSPVLVSYALFKETIISDPSRFEESIADAVVTFGLNTSGELCLLNMEGNMLITTNMLVHISKIAHRRAKAVLETIEDTIAKAVALEKENKINVGLSSLTLCPPTLEKKFNIHFRDFSYKVKTGISQEDDNGVEAME
ncbi:EXOSC9 family protein [Megaselia abdita]